MENELSITLIDCIIWSMITLYRWQEECLQKWKDNSYRGVIEVTTGGGKTILASSGAKRLRDEKNGNLSIYVVVPRIPLLTQWRDTLCLAGLEGAVIQNREKIIPSSMSIFTINRARDRVPLLIENDMRNGTPVLLILDEFHHYGSRSNYHLFDFRHSPYFKKELYCALGLSATAEVSQLKTHLIPAIGPLFYRYRLDSALRDRVVNPFILFNIAVRLNEEEREKYNDLSDRITRAVLALTSLAPSLMNQDLSLKEKIQRLLNTHNETVKNCALALQSLLLERRALIATADNRLKVTLEILKSTRRSDRILIFTERIEQVDALYMKLEKYGYSTLRYTSAMDRREKERNLNAFRSGEKHILIACRALDEGLDVPDCNVGIMLANTSQSLQRIQRTGRIIRKGKDKLPSLLYYVYCENTVEDTSLLENPGDDIITASAFLNEEDEIYSPDYYERIELLLDKARRKAEKSPRNLIPFILYGAIRPEQFSSSEELTERLEREDDPFFRSYLSLMTVLATLVPYSQFHSADEETNPFLK